MTYLVPIDKQQSMAEDDFKRLHRTDDLKEKMYQVQICQDSNLTNQMFLKVELEIHHNGQINETVCCIKNSLDSISLASVMKNSPFKKKSRLHRIKKVLFISTIEDVLNQEVILKMTMAAVTHIMDLIKDSLILLEI